MYFRFINLSYHQKLFGLSNVHMCLNCLWISIHIMSGNDSVLAIILLQYSNLQISISIWGLEFKPSKIKALFPHMMYFENICHYGPITHSIDRLLHSYFEYKDTSYVCCTNCPMPQSVSAYDGWSFALCHVSVSTCEGWSFACKCLFL